MRNRLATLLVFLILGLVFSSAAQAPQPPAPKRLTCEEITGGLYIANAQMSEQLREANAQLAEARAELAKRLAPPDGSVRPETK